MRPGGTPITIDVVNSNASVGELIFGGQIGQALSLIFNPGDNNFVAHFDPQGTGTTNVDASGSVVISTTSNAQRTVTVTGGGITTKL